jgi:cytochrome c oxidase cbb3-type subunit 3
MIDTQDPQTSEPAPAQEQTRRDVLTDHCYDGIQEYDNPTPSWWTWIFILTIIFSALYFYVVHTTDGKLSPIAYFDRAVVDEIKKQAAGGLLKADAATLVRLSKDPESCRKGESIFTQMCIACHGRGGEGATGPNLTDNSFIHVRRIEDIPDVIRKGRNNGAMPALGAGLNPNDVVLLSSYVASLRGRNQPGRPAEGQVIADWSEIVE